ncbi:ABC transporter substrate-binding protein [Bailinhaonella thermotolerans]|uniref:Extracellular solute-binding protein n=1 Tax=Bailinhaonella thermotolerans TaxID=1070861 RepID=A0A3A4ATM8_9ACTN|nr:extracellular solute-binding protein [Bailinhaonella thermotolerans]RJL32753.1 extracellular solute-binding protein [Bailinhaonella thermotolerans]
MTRRWLAGVIGGLTLGALALTACAPGGGGSTGGEGGKPGQVTLTVWSWRVEDAQAYKKIFGKFEAAHPNIKVDFKPFQATEYNNILGTGLSGGSGPDVAQIRSYGGPQALIEAGRLVPLDGKVAALSGFDAKLLQGSKGHKDGKVYGVPLAYQTLQVLYNKKLFAEKGVSVPTTWDELIAAAKKLKDGGVTPFAVAAGPDATWTLPMVHEIFGNARYGGAAFREALLKGEKKFTDPDFVASIKLLKDLQPYFPKDVVGVSVPEVQALFASGKAAMYPTGSFDLAPVLKADPSLEIGVFQAPPAPGSAEAKPVTVGWADGAFGINAKSPRQKEALELLNWMATPEFGNLVVSELKQLSAVPGATPADPLLVEMSKNYAAGGVPYLLLVDFRYGQPNGDAVFRDEVQKMLSGQTDAAAVAASVQKGVEQWFKPGS